MRVLQVTRLVLVSGGLILTAASAAAGVEAVRVEQVLGNEVVITRGNGESFTLTTGVGCLSLWRYVGKSVLVESPGLFLGIGSSLLLPEEAQRCPIWSSRRLDLHKSLGGLPALWPKGSFRVDPGWVAAIQRALALAGYDPGPVDGDLGPRTLAALDRYRQSRGYPLSESGLRATLSALAWDVLARDPGSSELKGLASGLSRWANDGEQSRFSGVAGRIGTSWPSCEGGHWVRRVSSLGRVVELEDGSRWEVSGSDRPEAMLWLSFDQVRVCPSALVNTDRGEAVSARQLR